MSGPELDAATARARLSQSIVPISELEQCPTGAALRRVLGMDVMATLDLPPFDNAAMDGYAVRSIDCTGPSTLRVAGRALAGHPFEGQVLPAEAVRIMTGAAMPAGADAVVAQENVQVRGDQVDILSSVPACYPRSTDAVNIFKAAPLFSRAGADCVTMTSASRRPPGPPN